jgi:O-antigen ligase
VRLAKLSLPAPWTARSVAALLFAFPLLIVSVRSWATGIFSLLALLSLWQLSQPRQPLHREERRFVGVLLFYFAIALLANSLSGWTYASVRWFSADLRPLLAIPIFLLLRAHPQAVVGLLRGVPIAGLLAGAYAIHLKLEGAERIEGPYGPIFLGNISVLLAVISVATVRYHTYPIALRLPLHLLGAAMALAAAVFSGTRGAWLAAAVALPIALGFVLMSARAARLRKYVAVGTVIVVGLVLALTLALAPRLVQNRVAGATEEAVRFLTAETPEQRDKAAFSSAGIRLEQWRVGLQIFSEHPLLGIGVGNVSDEINRRIAAGTASRAISVPDADEGRGSHLHSAYVDALVFKGGLGLMALLAIMAYPAYLAFRRGNRGCRAAGMIVTHVVAFAAFNLTEDPFIRNNFSSVYFVFLTCGMCLLFAETEGESVERPSVSPV